MKYIVAASLAIIAAMFAWGYMSASRADGLVCDPVAEVLKGALEKYHEAPVFDGATISGGPVIITMGPDGSWTMFLVQPGKLCGIAAGKLTAVPAPDAKPKTSAPLLMPHGLRWVRG